MGAIPQPLLSLTARHTRTAHENTGTYANCHKHHSALNNGINSSCCIATQNQYKRTDRKQQQHRQQPHNQQQQQRHQQHLNRHSIVAALTLATFLCCYTSFTTTLANPVFVDNPSLAQFQSGRNIRHLPCIVRKSGRSGVCMFAIDCLKQNGTHLGTCIDRFYFGSCCQMKEEAPFFAHEISDNSIDQNTISHFVHESTSLPTSALYKFTTESQLHADEHKNITSTSSSNSTPIVSQSQDKIAISTAGKPIVVAKPTLSSVPVKRPVAASTVNGTNPHKHSSQFVVRTTNRPQALLVAGKPTAAPTTIKPPRRKVSTTTSTSTSTTTTTTTTTTTAAPILTTTSKIVLEQRIETTTQPQKFFTFQMVETTTATPTEQTQMTDEMLPSLVDSTEPPSPPLRPKPISDSLLIKTEQPTTSTATTTTRTTTTTTQRATNRPKPSRRPATTKKPTQTKRPGSKPTRKPPTAGEKPHQRPEVTHPVVTRPRPPPPTLTTESETVVPITTEKRTTQKPDTTTRATRPRPKPTAEIIKVSRPTVDVTATTTKPASFTSNTEATKIPETTHTRPNPSQSTATPLMEHARPSSITTTTVTPTQTTDAVKIDTPSTTHAAASSTISTTLRPGLITWTNVDGEPLKNATTGADEVWQHRPPSADWVPVSTITPGTLTNRTTMTTTTTQLTTAGGATDSTTNSISSSTSTDKIIVSISSSISEMMHNTSAAAAAVAGMRPATISTTHSSSISTTTPTTSTSTTRTTTTTLKPTITTTVVTVDSSSASAEIDVESSTNPVDTMSTEDSLLTTGIGSTTTEYSTEDYNGNLSSTTVAPVNTLEGVNYREVCGRRMFPEPRIVGGSNAAFGRWPWQISLRQWRTSTYLHKCGAALLNENWAITAAHCVDNVPPSDLLLRLGEYDLAEEEEPYGYQERRVQIVASHPQFDPRTFEYDLALLRFYEPIVFQPNIIPVCVPDSDMDFIGQTAFVTGWGRLYEDGPLPSVLQEVAVPVINNSICETMYRSAGYIEHIPHIFICAGWKKGGYDSCEGDSGGPMVLQREEDKRFQLGGVISWGIGCAEANQPGVYTRISEFRDWINQILQF